MSSSKKQLRYRVGIDVGLYSVGLSAIEIDDSSDNPYDAFPIQLLSTISFIHDAGVDPQRAKYAESRKASAGVQRRIRRMRKRKHKRLAELDSLLIKFGYPVDRAKSIAEGQNFLGPEIGKSYSAWNARIYAANQYIKNDAERLLTVTVAIRHIARHRGWRNPYSNVSSIVKQSSCASAFYTEYYERVAAWLLQNRKNDSLLRNIKIGTDDDGSPKITIPQELLNSQDRPTPAQLIAPFLDPQEETRFRRSCQNLKTEKPVVSTTQIGKLHQSDYCYEILKIFSKQKVSKEQQKAIIDLIFKQLNPRDIAAAAQLVGKDSLPGQEKLPRASRSSLAFQHFRILDTITNLRIHENSNIKRKLTIQEIHKLYTFLVQNGTKETTWEDVAEELNIDRNSLIGVGGQTIDGDPISAKYPPVMDSVLTLKKAFKKKELAALAKWWEQASNLEKEFFIEFLDNAGFSERHLDEGSQKAFYEVARLLESFSEEILREVEQISLPSGRSSYSLDSLNRLNKRMLDEGLDLHTARKKEFNIDDSWKPLPNPLGSRVGNPSVDRTISIVSRWIKACEKRWGKPETINIEHVRSGFTTPKTARKIQKEMDKRHKANNLIREQIVAALDEQEDSGTRGTEAISHSDIRRWQAIQRQNCQCIYCGKTINYQTAQMDHIVPRKGAGSTNELPNLVAACQDCNRDKNNTLFYTWAATDAKRKEVLDRVNTWTQDSYFSSKKQFSSYIKEVKSRLRKKEEDDPLDARSIESVAWMARELRGQIEGYFGYSGKTECSTSGNETFSLSRVNVYRGSLTAEARRASGIENKLPWLGGSQKKTRLDRRHHAIDASVIAMMRPSVGVVLAKRESLRREQLDSNLTLNEQLEKYGKRFWKDFTGSNDQEKALYLLWRDAQMVQLADLLIEAMKSDKIIVTNNLRLRLGNGRAHRDEIHSLIKRHVGDALTPTNIDKAATPALWLALTTHPDYDPVKGLPEDWSRRIRIHDQWLDAYSTITFMAKTEEDFSKQKDAVYAPVRHGFAEIGDSIHHARFYRIPKINKSGKQTGWKFAYMRVFKIDLLKNSTSDLFRVKIPPQATSYRAASKDLRKALSKGTAEYLGWAIAGDEIKIDPSSALFSPDGKNAINSFMKAFPTVDRFKIVGFSTRDKITLEPLYISREGIPSLSELTSSDRKRIYGREDISDREIENINTVLGIKGSFHPSVDKLLSSRPSFIRRNSLGEIRWSSKNHMPVSWSIPKE